MNSIKKIAIYSGEIPASTFTEHLIEGISKYHKVYLFGRLNPEKYKPYKSSNVYVYPIEPNQVKNLCLVIIRSVKLLIFFPKRFRILIQQINLRENLKLKWKFYQILLPLLLYKPDILHVQWAKDIRVLGFMGDNFRTKIILSLLGTHINYTPVVNKKIAQDYCYWFPKIDAFIAVSEAIKLEAIKYKADAELIKVVRSPIPDFFFNAYQPYKKKQEPDSINLVSVGRFHWIKGIDYAIQAIKVLKERGYKVIYTIIGRVQVPIDILYTINDLDLKGNIKIIGHIEQDEIISQYKNHDILILPSVMEGIANVALEAMAVGLPVISTDCGGMPEVVIPEETGWLVPIRNPKAIANAVVTILKTDESKIKNITNQAHRLVKSQYQQKHTIAKVLKLYDTVSKTV